MLQKKYAMVLQLLMNQKKPTTSAELSLELGVSIRTIKSYIREINAIAGSQLIYSSSHGYTVNQKAAQIFLESEFDSEDIPQTWEERFAYIFRIFYSEQIFSIDVFDLCDELYISPSTLRADLCKMNERLSTYSIQLSIQKNRLVMQATEEAIRRLKTDLLFDDLNHEFLDLTKLSSEFPALDVAAIIRSTSVILRRSRLYMNDIAFSNFILYICVTADRLLIKTHTESESVCSIIHTEPATLEIVKFLREEQHIPLSVSDIHSIDILVKAHSNLLYETPKEAEAYIGTDCLTLCQNICEKVHLKYEIDLATPNFQIPFSMHLKSLLFRTSRGLHVTNPMADIVCRANPFIFDLAVFISIQIAQQKNIMLNKDEITYIAVHIGAELQRQQDAQRKIQAVFYCPDYVLTAQELTRDITKLFQGDLYLTKICTNAYDMHEILPSVDLLITVAPLSGFYSQEIFRISPIPSADEWMELYKVCNRIRKKKQYSILIEHFDDFFSPMLFSIDDSAPKSKETIIQQMAEQIIQTGVISPSFVQDVLERERSASTGFNGIAIPHGTKDNAVESRICVLVSRNGIRWDKQKVHLVLLFALNKKDQHIFPQLYDTLVNIFQHTEVLQKIATAADFNSFKQQLENLHF